ncbi:MAG TPA: tetratricopeptide repeat protein [Phycisphaerae bacterium]|nr:tetratricopeptide repeat protein [Phycisphaerae bacterium]
MAGCLTPAQIESLLAGTLSAQEQRRAEEHAAVCEACRGRIEARRTDEKLFGQIKEARPDETLLRPASPRVSAQAGLPVNESIEGYEILREIHRGGQGVVYKAVQKTTKRTVALKVLLQGPYASPKQRHRFEREIDLVASLQHPNIVTIYDSGVAGGRHFFAMEYIHGQPLDAYLSDKHLGIDDTLQLLNKICAAVNYAHQRGVIHRDLKPGNILVDADGQPHVVDFGLAKAAGLDLHDGAPMTVTGEFMGTLAYASPEQTRGDPNLIDIRTDVYSLGVILYEMLTGKYPYPVVGQMGEVLRHIAETEPTRPSTVRRQVNDEVETIVLKALAKEKDRRYASAEALGRDVERYLGGEAIEAKRDSAFYVLRKSLRRYRLPVALAASFVAIITVSLIVSVALWRAASKARDRAVVAEKQQSRERESAEAERRRAEKALTAEAEQRKLAEQRREEADAARVDAQQRQKETQTVAEFQSRMLADIDVPAMGRGIVQSLRDQVKAGLERQTVDEWPNRRKRTQPEIEATLKALDEAVAPGHPVDLARRVIDDYILKRAAATLEQEFAGQPLILAQIDDALGTMYDRLGLFDTAAPYLRAALELRRRELGGEHLDVATSLEHIAWLAGNKRDYVEAQRLYEEAVALRRRLQGNDHEDVAGTLYNFADLQMNRGNATASEPLYREALAIYRKAHGESHRDTLRAWTSLVLALRSQNKDVALALELPRGLSGLFGALSKDDAEVLKTYKANFVSIAFPQQRDPLPQPLVDMIPRMCTIILGEKNPEVAITLIALAHPLQAKGDLAAAERLYREALAVNRRLRGDEHPEVAAGLVQLARLLQAKGDLAAAEPLVREALAIQRKLLGDEHTDTLVSMELLANCHYAQGKYQDAQKLYEQTLEIRRRVLGPEHADTLRSMRNLAYAYYAEGIYADAEPLFRAALAARLKISGASHADTMCVRGDLINLYVKQKRFEDARPLVVEQIQYQRAAADQPGASAWDLNIYAWTLLTVEPTDLRDSVAGLGYARRAVEANGGKNGWIMNTLGVAQYRAGRFGEALKTEEKAIALLPPGDSRVRQELEVNLAKFRQAAASQPTTRPTANPPLTRPTGVSAPQSSAPVTTQPS